MTDDALEWFDRLAERVYTERRLAAGTRDLVLALGWAALRDPARHRPEVYLWDRVREVLNTDNLGVWRLIADDVPR
jgi:hypothetical protein